MLLDTGVFVALLDRSEKAHGRCVEVFRSIAGNIFATEAVLTETVCLLGPSARAQRAAIEFILEGGATLVPQSVASLARAADLIARYRNVPMDFADATLVALAEETGVHEILTLDVRGFSILRIHGKKPFAIRP